MKIREISRKFASDTIKRQKKSINQWGILCDISSSVFENSFTRLGRQLLHIYEGVRAERVEYMKSAFSPSELFKEMVSHNCVYRGLKPVYWSPQSRTALAEAELEYCRSLALSQRYHDHQSPSIYVTFDIRSSPNPSLQSFLDTHSVQAVVSRPCCDVACVHNNPLDHPLEHLSVGESRCPICGCANGERRVLAGDERSCFVARFPVQLFAYCRAVSPLRSFYPGFYLLPSPVQHDAYIHRWSARDS